MKQSPGSIIDNCSHYSLRYQLVLLLKGNKTIKMLKPVLKWFYDKNCYIVTIIKMMEEHLPAELLILSLVTIFNLSIVSEHTI